MPTESEHQPDKKTFDANERIMNDSQVHSLIKGIKPAVYMAWKYHPGQEPDPEVIRERLAQQGVEALVLSTGLIVNLKQVQERVESEPEFATAVHWDTTQSVEENVSRPSVTATHEERDLALIGFILGYPRSSIEAYLWKEGLNRAGVPTFLKEFFLPSDTANIEINKHVTDNAGREIVTKLCEAGNAYQQIKLASFATAASQQDRIHANDVFDKNLRQHLDDVRHLYRQYWQLDDQSIDRLLEPRRIRFQNALGEDHYYFTTCGTNSENSSDILELEQRIRAKDAGVKKIVRCS